MSAPAHAIATKHPDGSTSYFWEDENGPNTLTVNVPDPGPLVLTRDGRVVAASAPAARLEYLRAELRAERVSYAELAELQALADAGHIPPDDAEMREAAGLPEHATDDAPTR